tara:strand:- start:501 stop:725 length:225 start_codon:yes stop_codon:yes gene_type:complete
VKSAHLALHTDFVVDTVDDRIFGGFLEHMGRSIYEGVYDPEIVLSRNHEGWAIQNYATTEIPPLGLIATTFEMA